jgi:predicted enzyme related to lactoylglutathione lyase
MRLRCVNIVSADPRRLAEFYEIILGANIDESRGGPHRIEMWFADAREEPPGNRPVLIVVNYDAGYTPRTFNACHGFELHVADANAEYRRVQALGVEVKEPPKDLPWGYRYFHIEDPDGNGVDIVQAL